MLLIHLQAAKWVINSPDVTDTEQRVRFVKETQGSKITNIINLTQSEEAMLGPEQNKTKKKGRIKSSKLSLTGIKFLLPRENT